MIFDSADFSLSDTFSSVQQQIGQFASTANQQVLRFAVEHKMPTLASLAVELGANPNDRGPAKGKTLSSNGYLCDFEVIKSDPVSYLVAWMFSNEKKDAMNCFPVKSHVQNSAIYFHYAYVDFFESRTGVRIHPKNYSFNFYREYFYDDTPHTLLLHAFKEWDVPTIKVLLSHGADIQHTVTTEKVPFDQLALGYDNSQTVQDKIKKLCDEGIFTMPPAGQGCDPNNATCCPKRKDSSTGDTKVGQQSEL